MRHICKATAGIETQKSRIFAKKQGYLPVITLWTSYGINEEYIKQRVQNAIEESMNPQRVKHSRIEQNIGVSDGYGKHGVPYDVGESLNWNRVERSEMNQDISQNTEFEEKSSRLNADNINFTYKRDYDQSNVDNRRNRNNPKGYSKANTVLKYAILAFILICLIAFAMRS